MVICKTFRIFALEIKRTLMKSLPLGALVYALNKTTGEVIALPITKKEGNSDDTYYMTDDNAKAASEKWGIGSTGFGMITTFKEPYILSDPWWNDQKVRLEAYVNKESITKVLYELSDKFEKDIRLMQDRKEKAIAAARKLTLDI